ncbi:MAG: ABC transporter substrate-binding protein [Clostridiales Family XIII bacterium]|jgi:ABC-type nitrate/sulfonate/bicarbonate transport system substrate-binding protein|nr:ABC transporter substrate-binding protein [Clostridiales Family XIII bacterium]
MSKRKYVLFLMFFVIVALCAAGCGGNAGDVDESGAAGGQQAAPLKIGLLRIDDSIPFYVAEKEGLFEAEGVAVQLVPFNSSADQSAAMEAGELDMAMNDMIVQALMRKGGTDTKAVAFAFGATPSEGRFLLLGSPDSGLEAPAGAGWPDGARPRDGSGWSEGAAPRDGSERPDGMPPRDVSERPDGMPPRDGSERPDGMPPRDGSERPDGAPLRDGSERPDGMPPRDGSERPNGAGGRAEGRRIIGAEGKTVAISSNTMMDFLLSQFASLGYFAPDLSDVNVISMPNLMLRVEALIEGRDIQMAILPDPLASYAVQAGCTILIDDTRLGVNLSQSVVLATADALASRGGDVARVLSAYFEGMQLINSQPDHYRDFCLETANVPAGLSATYPTPSYTPGALPSEEDVARVMDWMVGRGLLENAYSYGETVDAEPARLAGAPPLEGNG